MTNLLLMVTVFVFSFVVGYFLISRIPTLLHTPLMSMTNAISAVTILGVLILFSTASTRSEQIIGSVAFIMAAFNLVGGFAITDRMLRMFRKKQQGDRKS
ncbi:MAG: NAD(P) transhydrogenase subunit alpha [Desulfotignum sp.]|nr:NAD(P) transhydrogenase subunit alpha [Desulfobacteraceae bacterium]